MSFRGYSDRLDVNLVSGQAGVSAGSGTVDAKTVRVVLATDDPLVSAQAASKTSAAIGTQQTNVDNVSDQYLAYVDLADASYHDVSLQVKVVQASGSDESANDFTLFWAFCSEELSTPSDAPTVLSTSEFSLTCPLVDATAGATTRYYQSGVIVPKARYLYVWYDCDDLTNPLTSVDVVLNKLS